MSNIIDLAMWDLVSLTSHVHRPNNRQGSVDNTSTFEKVND